ncbi:FkbM family methyltransferase [Trichothermofontia sp.]
MDKIFIYGLIKNAEKYLEMQILELYKAFQDLHIGFDIFLFENDSKDSTKAICNALTLKYNNLIIYSYDGLDAVYPLRTVRLSFLRNQALNQARERGGYTFLLALDMDGPNFKINSSDLKIALDFLSHQSEVAAVFPNSKPFYYDAYAVKSDQWFVDKSRWISSVFESQRIIPISSSPIEVISAFNGAGLYKLESIPKTAQYLGWNNNEEACEHIFFNQAIHENGYKLVILPQWYTQAPLEHIFPYLNPRGDGSRLMKIVNGNQEISLYLPIDHPFEKYFTTYPLYDRRFPLLTFLFSIQEPHKSIIDIGSNVLDGISLIRLAGVKNKIYAIDASYEFCKYALLNQNLNPLLENVEIMWGFVDPRTLAGNLGSHQGSASIECFYRLNIQPSIIELEDFDDQVGLIKVDTDGLDAIILFNSIHYLKLNCPIIFTECFIREESDIKQWSDLLLELSSHYTHYIVFDNFGFCLYAGAEWKRILKPGGILRLVLPDFEALAKLYVLNQVPLEAIVGYIHGGHGYPENIHYWSWDFQSLHQVLTKAGFENIRRFDATSVNSSEYEDYSTAQVANQLVSLNVEATKANQLPLSITKPASLGQIITLQIQATAQIYNLKIFIDPQEYTQKLMLDAFSKGIFYEPEVSQVLIKILEKGDNFIDIGAHIGYFSLWAALLVGKEGKVLTCEPEHNNHLNIIKNIEINNFENIRLLNVAVGDQCKTVQFFLNEDNGGGHALWDVGKHPFNQQSRINRRHITVNMITIDHLFEYYQLDKVKLIKIDTEGAEYQVLRGASTALSQGKISYVIAEINRFGLEQMETNETQLRSFMEGFGYKAYLLEPQTGQLIKLVSGQYYNVNQVFNVLFSNQEIF